jgi:hypothetical protein
MLKKIGTFWGKLKITAGLIGLYIQAFNFILLTITAYPVIIEWFHEKGIVFPFWLFEIVVFSIVMSIITFEWKFSLPGYYRASNDQTWNNENPMRKEIEAIRAENTELKKLILEVLKNQKEIKS